MLTQPKPYMIPVPYDTYHRNHLCRSYSPMLRLHTSLCSCRLSFMIKETLARHCSEVLALRP